MPQIDLHGEDRISANIKVKSFLNDNYKIGNDELAIIHGIGTGALRQEVKKILKSDKRVLEYCVDIFNGGCTLVKLNKKVDKKHEVCYNNA